MTAKVNVLLALAKVKAALQQVEAALECLPQKKRRRSIEETQALLSQVQELLGQGLRAPEIARRVGCCHAYVYRVRDGKASGLTPKEKRP